MIRLLLIVSMLNILKCTATGSGIRIPMETSIFQTLSSYQIIGKPSPNLAHKVVFAVKQRNLARIDAILEDVSNPLSANYGNYLTRDQVAEITMNDESSTFVADFLNGLGVSSVQSSTYGEYIAATAPISFWDAFFDTEFVLVGPSYGPKFVNNEPAPDDAMKSVRTLKYSLPQVLSEHVLTVLNTVQTPLFSTSRSPNSLQPHHFDPLDSSQISLLNQAQAVEDGGFIASVGFTYPKLLNKHYNIFTNKGNGLNTQGVVGSSGQKLYNGDQRIFDHTFGLPVEQPKTAMGPQGHMFNGYCTDIFNCFEANLDVQYMMGTAQNSPTTFWYHDDENGATFSNWICEVASSRSPPKVFSISYAMPEFAISSYEKYVFDTEAKKLSIQGVTLVAASGDSGVAGDQSAMMAEEGGQDTCGYTPSFPASSIYVTAVGATKGPELGHKEVAAENSRAAGDSFTTGGGFSNMYELPVWQKKAVSGYFSSLAKQPFTNNSRKVFDFPYPRYNPKGRGYPDVSLLGTRYIMVMNGSYFPMDGTSCSTPVVAAMFSLVNSARISLGQPTLGWVNPALYSANYSIYNDVTSGENNCLKGFLPCCREGFKTAPGWDPVTGLGSIDFRKFYDYFTTFPGGKFPKHYPSGESGSDEGKGVDNKEPKDRERNILVNAATESLLDFLVMLFGLMVVATALTQAIRVINLRGGGSSSSSSSSGHHPHSQHHQHSTVVYGSINAPETVRQEMA